MTPEEADAKQEWKGMDGAIAFSLIGRHADNHDEAREMMHAWLRANQGISERNLQTFNYAKTLAIAIQEKHFPEATQWKPLDDTLGLLTQIDNMVSRLVKHK